MKRIFIVTILLGLFIFQAAMAAQDTQKKEDCKEGIQGYIQALDDNKKICGKEGNLGGLTKNDILKMLETKSSCEVYYEITKRIMKNDENKP